jgi:hypothetical protein
MRGALVGVLVGLMAAGTARAEVVDDNPAASSRGPGQVSVFIRGADGALQTSELSGDGFTPWRSLGGVITSGPGAAARSAAVSDVFARGTDDGLYHKYFWSSVGDWSAWEAVGGGMLSAPGVDVRRGSGYIDMYYRGPDNGIVARSWVPGAGWTGEDTTSLDPGLTLSAPALVTRGGDQLDVIVRGTNDYVHIDVWNGSAWSGWAQIPGGMITTSAPAATTRQAGTFEVFVRTPQGGVRWISWDGGQWSAWKTVPGAVDSGLAAVSDDPSRIYLFARRGNDVIWNLYDRGRGAQDGWRGWQSMHPAPPPPPPPLSCDPDKRRLTATSRMVDFGRRPRIAGRARWPNGGPLAGATVSISPRKGGWVQRTTAGPDGHYATRIPAGPSRTMHLEAWAPGSPDLACATLKVRTRAGVRLHASRHVRPGGRVRFHGRLLGKPIPRRGKLIEIQAFDGGRWRTFATPRSKHNGRFKTSYKLERTFGPRTFRFRARVRREAGYPYELGSSHRVKVRVS